jgi:hypothetical protein
MPCNILVLVVFLALLDGVIRISQFALYYPFSFGLSDFVVINDPLASDYNLGSEFAED